MAIIGLLEPPGRIDAGEIRLAGPRIDNLPCDEMRRIRGHEIDSIFQDPLTSRNPLYTVGQPLVENITTHLNISASAARQRRLRRIGRDPSASSRTHTIAGRQFGSLLNAWRSNPFCRE